MLANPTLQPQPSTKYFRASAQKTSGYQIGPTAGVKMVGNQKKHKPSDCYGAGKDRSSDKESVIQRRGTVVFSFRLKHYLPQHFATRNGRSVADIWRPVS